MEIQVQLTRRDLVAFHLSDHRRSPRARAQRLLLVLVPPVMLIGALLWVIATRANEPFRLSQTLLFLFPILPLYLVLLDRVIRRRAERRLARSADTEQSLSLLGDYLIAITPEGVTATRHSERTSRRWEDISRVVADDDHGYIYTGAYTALIIPRRCFPDEHAFRAFVKAAVIYHWDRENVAGALAQPLAAAGPALSHG